MKKSLFLKSILAAFLLLAVSSSMVSCQSLVDAFFGEVDNPTPSDTSKSDTSKVEVTDISMLETALTLEAITDGTIKVDSPKVGMQYTLNGATKTAVTSTDINVVAGDIVQFYGDGTNIASYDGTMISGGTADCYIYGNIMSLIDETGFATNKKLDVDETFKII